MMRNPIYKGELTNGHTHQFSEYVIIEPSVWARVQSKATATPGRKDAGRWAVLGGMLFCGGCDHRMTPRKNGKFLYYVGQNTKCVERAGITPGEGEPLVAEAADDYFAEFISPAGPGGGRGPE